MIENGREGECGEGAAEKVPQGLLGLAHHGNLVKNLVRVHVNTLLNNDAMQLVVT